uniref:G-protein coupled receptors family 1 profile domain-containing protein n=1 Tax=Biomphalaria glabrata TaxID=6526 RepID=A0A2C9LAF7_BIOGL
MSSRQSPDGVYNVTNSFLSNGSENASFSENLLDSSVTKVVISVSFTSVFLLSFIGNVMVLFVLTRSTLISSRTNLFLANLAIADLCVGIFCVIPTMIRFLTNQWYFGQVLCKVSRFVENVNLTASMFLQEVIAGERYIAIKYPLQSRHLFSRNKLYVAQFLVWLVSCLYNIPFLVIFDTLEIPTGTQEVKIICLYKSNYESLHIYYICTFVIWYAIPLVVMTILYYKIGRTLWKSNALSHMMKLRKRIGSVGSSNMSDDSGEMTTSTFVSRKMSEFSLQPDEKLSENNRTDKRDEGVFIHDKKYQNEADLGQVQKLSWFQKYSLKKKTFLRPWNSGKSNPGQSVSLTTNISETGENWKTNQKFLFTKNSNVETNRDIQQNRSNTSPLQDKESKEMAVSSENQQPKKCLNYRVTSQRANSRRRIIRLLIVLLITFALLVLPNHIRLITFNLVPIRLHWFPLISPVCQFLMYLNSAMNPIIYSLMSKSFRRGMKETMVSCLCKH